MAEQDEKIDNSLNLALQVPETERMQSRYLQYGYDQTEKSWQIIVKHIGDIKRFENIFPDTQVVELLNQFAVITTREEYISAIAAMPEIQFVEKPKRLYFNLEQGRSASCINTVQKMLPSENAMNTEVLLRDNRMETELSGKGVLVAIIDSGERVSILSEYKNGKGVLLIAFL